MVNQGDAIQLHVSYVVRHSLARLAVVSRRGKLLTIACLSRIPQVFADDPDSLFTARPAVTEEEQKVVQEDISSMIGLATWKSLMVWKKRGDEIRNGHNLLYCVGNLSLALNDIGPIATYSYQGASGALSLLPTAGALIGAPAKELWILYKLMPLAGVLSMVLSLGGNIIPMQHSDYEVSSSAFSYGGFIATRTANGYEKKLPKSLYFSSAEAFADAVEERAHEICIPNKRANIGFGIFTQLFWLGILPGSCFTTQQGGVVAWWCEAWGWMYFWYLMVAISSLFENFAGVPFTKQWTIRVSKAPKVHVSDEAPRVTDVNVSNAVNRSESLLPSFNNQASSIPRGRQDFHAVPLHYESQGNFSVPRRRPVASYPGQTEYTRHVRTEPHDPLLPPHHINSDSFESDNEHPDPLSTGHRFTNIERTRTAETFQDKSGGSSARIYPVTTNDSNSTQQRSRTNTGFNSQRFEKDILSDLDTGFDSISTVFMDPNEPYTIPRTPFYVIISLKGISGPHATLRVFAKAITVGVFAAGTAMFASVTLITISVALMTLCIVLAVGVFSRVAALWMASEMMKMDPIIHRVVDTRQEAAELIEAMLRKQGLVFEVMGQVIIDGRSVSRYNKWLSWSTLFGVLAPPFYVSKIATTRKMR